MKTKTSLIVSLSFALAGFAVAQTSPSATTSPKSTAASASTNPSSATSPTSMSMAGAPYTEGSVWQITMIKSKPGMEDDYFRQLSQGLKPIYEEQKKQKLLLDYKILLGESSDAHDYNILIMVEYQNMAAFDGLREKTDPIMAKVMGGQDQQRQLTVKRGEVREILGSKTMREITLK
jgi:hypothetical protein